MSLWRQLRSTLVSVLVFGAVPHAVLAEVPVDHTPNTLSLPEVYPDSWVFVYAASQPVLGSYAIIDVNAADREYKGQFQGAFYPSLITPNGSSELYIGESAFENVSHGKRTDVLTITRKSTLNEVGQIILPGAKRGIIVGNIMDVTHDGKLILILNFTPASSVTVVDIEHRKVIGEVPIPGCTSVYPTGPHGFASLCGDGTLTAFSLGTKGRVIQQSRSTVFYQVDKDPLFLQPAVIGTTAYFVSRGGNIQPVNLARDKPEISPSWPLITPEQRADGWRTADGSFAAGDGNGSLYVRVYRETGYAKQERENSEVWVYDVSAKTRTRRIPLKNGGTSIEVTRGSKPYLVVTAESDPNIGESLDVYDASNATWVRTIGGWATGNTLTLVQAKR